MLAAAILVGGSGGAHGATLRVPAEFATIGGGVEAGSSGDTVLVAAGKYSGPGNTDINPLGKELVIMSESGAESTIIQCSSESRGFVFDSGEGSSMVVDGFWIRGGDLLGAAVFCDPGTSPTLRRCVFSDHTTTAVSLEEAPATIVECEFRANSGFRAGALDCYYASPLVEDCLFEGNRAGGGGAVHCFRAEPQFVRCRFVGNTTYTSTFSDGGAILCESASPVLTDCIFEANEALSDGGAVSCSGASYPLFTRCEFLSNEAVYGGAAEVKGGRARFVHCRFVDNQCRNQCLYEGSLGGAVLVQSSGTIVEMIYCALEGNISAQGGGILAYAGARITLVRCLLARNAARLFSGGAVLAGYDAIVSLSECTIVENDAAQTGGGVYIHAAAQVDLVKTIIAHGSQSVAVGFLDGPLIVRCTDIFGNADGDWVGPLEGEAGRNGNFSADPRFCSMSDPPYSLAANSPCLPGQHPTGESCGLIGARDVGCPAVAVEASTWGGIKARFRER